MSFLFPHVDYAEDQPLAYTILTTHVLHRAVQTGVVLSLPVGAIRTLVNVRRSIQATSTPNTPASSSSMSKTLNSISRKSFWPEFQGGMVRSAGTGAAISVAFVGVALVVRMFGKEEIEWKDRAWRLLANSYQVEVDSWSLLGAAGGLATVVAASRAGRIGSLTWRTALGGAGLGNMVGVMGYMAWRHGINGGKYST